MVYGKRLYESCEQGDVETVQWLIDMWGDRLDINWDGSYVGATPLHAAARSGNVDLTRLLLDRKAKVNAQSEDGKTPLHYAVWPDFRQDVLSLLLERGADARLKDHHGRVPFQMISRGTHGDATRKGYAATIALLEHPPRPVVAHVRATSHRLLLAASCSHACASSYACLCSHAYDLSASRTATCSLPPYSSLAFARLAQSHACFPLPPLAQIGKGPLSPSASLPHARQRRHCCRHRPCRCYHRWRPEQLFLESSRSDG